MRQLHKAIVEVLQQVESLVVSCDVDDYAVPSQHSMSSVGQHVRHILDHFMVFKDGLESHVIDYNIRSRGNPVETDPQAAANITLELIDWFQQTALENTTIDIISEISVADTQTMTIESNLARELTYLVNHTIHHLAYASLVAKQLNQPIGRDLGIAPATATYLRNQEVASQA